MNNQFIKKEIQSSFHGALSNVEIYNNIIDKQLNKCINSNYN